MLIARWNGCVRLRGEERWVDVMVWQRTWFSE